MIDSTSDAALVLVWRVPAATYPVESTIQTGRGCGLPYLTRQPGS
jgi:hypothetical protein